jgi:hypothetical protein
MGMQINGKTAVSGRFIYSFIGKPGTVQPRTFAALCE